MSEGKVIHKDSLRRLVPLRILALDIGAANRSYCLPGDGVTITISATAVFWQIHSNGCGRVYNL